MKRQFLLFLTVLFTSTLSHAQWNIQLDTENFTSLDRINFIDENYGWAIGANNFAGEGPYFFTEDGGDNWYIDPYWYDADYWGTDIVFFNQDTGFIAGIDGKIFKTIDGGNNWMSVQTPANQNVIKLVFVDESNGWATLGQYSEGNILHTSDGGNNWELQNVCNNCYDNVTITFFIDQNIGWLASSFLDYDLNKYVLIKKTEDGGEEWTTLDSANLFSYHYRDIFFIDTLKGWITGSYEGDEYLIRYTEDGGQTWTEQELPDNSNGTPQIANCVYFVNDSVGWIGAGEPTLYSDGYIYLTTDGGENWNFQQEFWDSGIFDIQMLDQDTGWAVGGSFVYHTTNGDTITITGLNEKHDQNVSFTTKPNPTNGIFSTEVSGDKQKSYSLLIRNTMGQTVLHLENISLQQLNSRNINISNQPVGIYFITLFTGTGKPINQINYITQKIIKL